MRSQRKDFPIHALIARIVFFGVLFAFSLTDGVRSFYFRSGLRWQYIFLLAFMGSVLFTPIARVLAERFEILDRPSGRKAHADITPLLGGLAVQASFAVALLVNNVFLPQMTVLLAGATLIFLIGLWDDIRPLNAALRFLFQVLVSLYVILAGNISLTFFSGYAWSSALNVPLTALWLVGLTNAMNFFDGLDGLAPGLSVIIAAFFGTVAFMSNQPAMGWFAVALVGACLGFLPYNLRIRRSAQIFLGDAGSTFLGFTLAGLAVLGRWSTESAFVSIVVPVLILGVLIFDITYVTLSRVRNRGNDGLLRAISRPGRDHLHHRLIRMGFRGKEAVLIIFTLSTCFGVSALIIMDQNIIRALLGLVQALLVLGVFVVLMLKGRESDDN
jgi:UDP-GlcNAc:undecaprenyl-phosphate GlcNAc-1-phosphate transferase